MFQHELKMLVDRNVDNDNLVWVKSRPIVLEQDVRGARNGVVNFWPLSRRNLYDNVSLILPLRNAHVRTYHISTIRLKAFSNCFDHFAKQMKKNDENSGIWDLPEHLGDDYGLLLTSCTFAVLARFPGTSTRWGRQRSRRRGHRLSRCRRSRAGDRRETGRTGHRWPRQLTGRSENSFLKI